MNFTSRPALADIILKLIPDYPEILEMESAFDLLEIDGFDCGDLQPSLAQVHCALSRARQILRKQQKERLQT